MEQPITIKMRLEKILNTVVSQDIINKLNEKESTKLTFNIMGCESLLRINKPDLYQEDIDENIKTIKSILDNGKSRLPIKKYHGTGQYNQLNK